MIRLTIIKKQAVAKPKKRWVFIPKPKLPETGRWTIKSQSDGRKHYVVIRKGKNHLTCNCKGWIFTRHCKHIQAKAKQLGIKVLV
jgi:hypothetical protein